MPRKIGELFFELRTSSEALSRDLKDGERQFGKFAGFIKANPLAAVTGLGAAFAGIAFQASQAAAKIDLSFRQVANTLGVTGTAAAALRADLRAVSIASGESQETIAKLFKTIGDNGPNGAQNVRALADAALALTKILGGDAAANAAGLDLITDIFGIDPGKARQVAASLFEVARGRVPLDDLLGVLSKIGPEAQALGLDFDTTTAFLVRFLDQGYSTKRVSSLFKELADNGAEGRAEIIRLAGATGDAAAAMESLNKAQQDVENSAAELQKKVKNELNVAWEDFGGKVLPAVTTSLVFLNGLLDGTGTLAERSIGAIARVIELRKRLRGETLTEMTGTSTEGGTFSWGDGIPNRQSSYPSAADLGKRLADIQTATKKLEALSVSQLRENQRQLNEILATPGVGDAQVEKAKDLLGKIDEQIKAALTKSSVAAQSSAKEAAAAFQKAYNASLLGIASALAEVDRETQEAFDALAKQQKLTRAALEREADVREGTTASLRNQIEALFEGSDAYELLAESQAQVAAVDAADAKAAEAKLYLTQEEIDQIRAKVVENLRLAKVLEALKSLNGKNPFQIDASLDDVGALADQLSRAAGAAAGIAAAFGETGRSVSALIGQTAQLLTNVSRAQRAGIFTGKDGKEQNVGFLGALSGKAGTAGVVSAATSTLAVIGAVSSIAEALDLFGTQAKKRAAEMKDAARAFSLALQDFVAAANPTTGATAAIEAARKRAEELAKQAAAAGGGTVTFENGVTVESLRAQAAAARGFADELESSNAKLAKNFRTIASGFDDVANGLVDVEAAARRQVLANIEDLGVRRLQAAGLTEQATALRDEIAARRALAAASKDLTDEGQEYYRVLLKLTEAEKAAADATRARAAILRQLDDDNALLGGTSAQRIQRTIAALVQSFPDLFAGAFDGLDFSTSDGLARAKDIIKGFYNQLAVDGVSDAERPIVDFLKRLFGDIDSAIGDLPDVLDPLARQLEGFAERVQVFGLTLTEQLRELKTIFAGKFGETFDEILKNADLGTATGRAEFKNRLQQQISGILADGVITDAERPYYDALVRFLGLVNEALDDASAEAEQAITDAATARERSRGRAGNRVALFDLEGLDAFETILDGYGAAFSGLFDTFDLSSLAGIAQAKDVLRGIFTELEGLSDAEIFARFGLTRDELLAALLDTDSGLDSLASSLGDVAGAALAAAQAASDFAESVNNDYLRSTGNGQQADMNAAKSRRDARIKQAVQLGLGQAVIDQIEGIYQADITEIAGRYAEKASATVASTPAATSAARASTRTRSTSVVSDFGGLSEVTAQTLAGLQREVAINTAAIARGTFAIYDVLRGGLPSPPSSLLAFAGGVSGSSTSSTSGSVVIGSITVHVGALNPGGLSPAEAGSAGGRAILNEIARLANAEVRFLGSGKRA